MKNQTRKLLFDILDSGRSIQEWCHSQSYEEYEANRQLRRAVEREFEDPYSVFGSSAAPYKIYNIGNNQPVELMYFIETLEKCLGKTAIKNMMPIQPGDVPATFVDVND